MGPSVMGVPNRSLRELRHAPRMSRAWGQWPAWYAWPAAQQAGGDQEDELGGVTCPWPAASLLTFHVRAVHHQRYSAQCTGTLAGVEASTHSTFHTMHSRVSGSSAH